MVASTLLSLSQQQSEFIPDSTRPVDNFGRDLEQKSRKQRLDDLQDVNPLC